MRFGIDGSCWPNRRGFGRFTRALVTEMVQRSSHTFTLIIDQPSLAGAQLPEGLDVVAVPAARAATEAASAWGRRTGRDVLVMSRAAWRGRFDAFYFPATYTYFPVLGRTPKVVTVHDAIAERIPHLVLPTRLARLQWTLKQRAAIARARAVVTVSQAAADEIGRWLGVPEHRLRVIREAPGPEFRPVAPEARRHVLDRHGIGPGERYFLYVGGISPHKNLDVLVRAFEQVAGHHGDLRLLLVGDISKDPFLSATASLRQSLAASPCGDRVTLTGYVGDDDLVALYGGAVGTVLPSLGEGFGLTAAESAACGTPVVASQIPALAELLGDAALYAPPLDASRFAGHLSQLLDDPAQRARLAEASLARAASWSWASAAETVNGLLEETGSRRG